VVILPEENYCDDGNNKDGDGCSSTCQVEIGYHCLGGSKSCPDTCKEICGDGIDLGLLGCDDGNLVSGDGCSDKCEVELGFTCDGGSLEDPDICHDVCGDG
jgi:cysteine-rich repeat protein